MVKVKVEKIINVVNHNSFNHPMVKVKVEIEENDAAMIAFQPPYGES